MPDILHFLTENFIALSALACVAVSIGFFIQNRYSMLQVSFGILAALFFFYYVIPNILTGTPIVTSEEILGGFGNKALLAIMALLVVGQGLYITGAVAGPSSWLLARYAAHPNLVLLSTFGFIFAVSAFINNTPVVIIFLPILSAMALQSDKNASDFLMPLSFVTILAGMTTLIGTSTNLLAAEAYELALASANPNESAFTPEKTEVLFFDQTPFGLLLASIGLAFIALFGRFLLPKSTNVKKTPLERIQTQFILQFDIPYDSKLVGQKPESGRLGNSSNIRIRLIQRGNQTFIPPFRDIELLPHDRVVLAAPRADWNTLLKVYPEILQAMWFSNAPKNAEGIQQKPPQSLQLIEAIVAPGSRISDLSLGVVGFNTNTEILTMGIRRRKGMVRAALSEIRLEAGDTLLLAGTPEAIQDLSYDRDLVLMESTKYSLPTTKKAGIAIAITLAMILVSALNLVDITVAAFLAGTSMVMVGCLNVRQASRALDLDIFVIVAAALALGTVLGKTGATDLIANNLVELTLPYGPYAVLSAMFLLVAIFTNLLSNAATAVIFTPLAVSAAVSLGVDPFAFVITVILASNCCFATPIAYQTNLLVMGPGGYSFSDYLRFGLPLSILMWISFTIFAPFIFQF